MQKLIVVSFFAFSLNAVAADSGSQQQPKTKLESFVAQDGVVIVRGFSTVGEVKANYGGLLTVESKEFTNVTSGKKEYGITIEVKETGRLERKNTSYIDYDEIDSLVKGIDYISKVDKSATKLDDMQADYKTRGDLVVSTFSSRNGISAAIGSGTIGRTNAYFELPELAKLRALVVDAKAKLDAIRN